MSGNDGEEVTPVPIPNTEVKLFSADGSWGFPPVRVGRCQAMRRGSAEELVFFVCSFLNNREVNDYEETGLHLNTKILSIIFRKQLTYIL